MSREVETKAVQLVMEYERKSGRKPRDVSAEKCGYDIESSGRNIEVKGMSHPTGDNILLYKKLFTKLGKKISNYYIYVVFDIRNTPKMKVLPLDLILANVEIDTSFFVRAKAYSPLPIINL